MSLGILHIIPQIAVDFKNIVYTYPIAGRTFICCEKNKFSLHRVNLPYFSRVFLIRAAFLLCVWHEVNHRDQRMVSILYYVINQR